jgi:hypothetical protein
MPRPTLRSLLPAALIGIACAVAPARADVHTVRITEYYTQCSAGQTDIQYIEMKPFVLSQFFRQCASLQIKRTVGGPDVFFAKPIFAGFGNDQAWPTTMTFLAATAAWQAATGITADFTIPAGVLDPAGGVIRFAADSGCEPNANWGTIHEVRYGDQGTAPAPGAGQAAQWQNGSGTFIIGVPSPKNTAGTTTGSWSCDAVDPTVQLLSPNGGEVLLEGSEHLVTWSSSDNVGVVSHEIQLSINGGADFDSVASAGPTDDSYAWTVPENATTTQAVIRVVARDAAGNVAFDDSDAVFEIQDVSGTPGTPGGFLRPVLFQSRPNPFAGSRAVLGYALAKPGATTLGIYTVDGRLVRKLVDGVQPAGYGEVLWDGLDDSGRRVPNGVYYSRLETAGLREVSRIVVAR